MRKTLRSDRAVIYCCQADFDGNVVAESVLPEFPKTLWAEIKDPCFAEGRLDHIRSGHVHVIHDIHAAKLSQQDITQLQSYRVAASLAAPIILKNNQLYGLLIVHQCSGPRQWQQAEIDLVSQIAVQVGLALERTDALAQAEQAYQTAQNRLNLQRRQTESLNQVVSETLANSDALVKALATEATQQKQLLDTLDHQLKSVMAETKDIVPILNSCLHKGPDISQTTDSGLQAVHQINANFDTIQALASEAATTIGHIDQPVQDIDKAFTGLRELAAQIKLQAMNATLEATRMGDSGQSFADMGEKVHAFARQLDADLANLHPLVAVIKSEIRAASVQVTDSQQDSRSGKLLATQTHQQLKQIADHSTHLKTLAEQAANVVFKQAQRATEAREAVSKLSTLTDQLCNYSQDIATSFNQLAVMEPEDKPLKASLAQVYASRHRS